MIKRFIFLTSIITLTLISSANAQVNRLTITRGVVEPISIALPAFSATANNQVLGREIAAVIQNNLESSSLFRAINPRAFIQTDVNVGAVPRFADWRQIKAQSLLTGAIRENGADIVVDFRLWDMATEKQFAGRSFTAPKANWRRVAHLISDAIYTRLTGEDAYFDSRIVYIAESGSWNNRTKRLAVMDQDGANHQYLTSGRTMVLTPRFDPSSQRIIYMAYYNNQPRVYLYDMSTGREELIGNFQGMSFAPRFSPDGKKAIMSISNRGNSEIYSLDLASRSSKRLTFNSAIDTSPSYSPDGKQVTFNSDRGGSPQIYVMDADGENVKRISYGKGSYATPVWSPRGDLIAFTRMYGGRFYIGVMKPDGSGERLLTESFMDEGPTWSPNGRVILFTRQERSSPNRAGKSYVYSVDLTGYNLTKRKTPVEASDPAWGPLLSFK